MTSATITANAPDSIVKAMAGRAVLVAGDIMLDRFVTGAVTRLSPEAPAPVLVQENQSHALGGAGNVLANLAGLGVTAHVLAIVGDDAPGRAVASIINTLGADGAGLLVDAARPTTVKTRFMAGHHHILRVDEEKSGPVDDVLAARILKHAENTLPHVQAVILSDYGKGVLTPAILAALIKMARARNIPVLVDPKGVDYARYAGATAVTPNRAELALAAGTGALKTDAEIVAAAQSVMKASGVGAVIATRSEDGISVIAQNVTHIPTIKLPVFDVAGAGDTVIATVAAALATGATLEDAARLANRAGGIVVGKPGTAAITAGELSGHVYGGAVARDAAALQIRLWQSHGLRVGFTNGCFDILHIGHVTYLAQARGRCDRLVVAVNADESVKRLKGPARPVNDVAARAGVLGALGCVDMVVVFGDVAVDDDKPCVILDTIRPDVIFKGGDYTEDQLPEAKVVRAYGGDVQIMSMVDGYSTTAAIAKMKA